MKKYYYITLIAMVATVCLQISYMFSLYNQDVSEDIINIGEVTKKIIEDEKDTIYRAIFGWACFLAG